MSEENYVLPSIHCLNLVNIYKKEIDFFIYLTVYDYNYHLGVVSLDVIHIFSLNNRQLSALLALNQAYKSNYKEWTATCVNVTRCNGTKKKS